MTRTITGVLFTAFLSLCLSASAQNPKQSPKQNPDRFEESHKRILTPAAGQGEHAIALTEAATKAMPQRAAAAGDVPRRNFVDEHIFSRIERDGIPHAGLSTDEEFIRRAYLDVTGLIPPVDAVREFVASKDADKREKLIDSLVGSEEFTEQWAWFWGDLFRLDGQSGDGKHAFQYWTKEWLRVDRPYNLVLHDLITGAAKSHSSIPALAFMGRVGRNSLKSRIPTDHDNMFLENRLDAIDEFSVDISRIFLGVNTDCISCHDGAGHLETINLHLSNRTRTDFARQAAFMGRTRIVATWDDRSKNVVLTDAIVDDLGKGYDTGDDAPFYTMSENRFPRDGKTYEPAFLLTGERPRPGMNPRAELARMIASHPQFARATANLIWGKLMTVGFVEPYDAFDLDRSDPANPPPKPWTVQPTNPELLNALAEDFRTHNFSIHRLMKTILKSSAYQLSVYMPGEWKDSYTPYYARKFVRVLTGPEVVDAIAEATTAPVRFQLAGVEVSRVKSLSSPGDVGGRRRAGAAAEQRFGFGEGPDVSSLMQSFFQSNRQTPAVTGNKATTLQTILMMSSPLVNKRVLAANGTRVQQLVESAKTNEEIIEELYLGTLARWPTPEERGFLLGAFTNDRKSAAENLQWSLLNGIEFLLNR